MRFHGNCLPAVAVQIFSEPAGFLQFRAAFRVSRPDPRRHVQQMPRPSVSGTREARQC